MLSAPTLNQGRSPSTPIQPAPQTESLVERLITWQAWRNRGTPTHKIAEACGARYIDTIKAFTALTRALDAMATVEPLNALAANYELIRLLSVLQGHALRTARKAGASWQQIAMAIGTTAEQACAEYLAHPPQAARNTDTKASITSAYQEGMQ